LPEDLNKASDDIVKKAKDTMNQEFEKNRKKPGDQGFQYDHRVFQ
jgi:hypothetical protein